MVVGSRGLGLVGRLRLGSVSTKVVRAGLGAVLVYPPVGTVGCADDGKQRGPRPG